MLLLSNHDFFFQINIQQIYWPLKTICFEFREKWLGRGIFLKPLINIGSNFRFLFTPYPKRICNKQFSSSIFCTVKREWNSGKITMTWYHWIMTADLSSCLILCVFIMFLTTMCVFTLCLTNVKGLIFQ